MLISVARSARQHYHARHSNPKPHSSDRDTPSLAKLVNLKSSARETAELTLRSSPIGDRLSSADLQCRRMIRAEYGGGCDRDGPPRDARPVFWSARDGLEATATGLGAEQCDQARDQPRDADAGEPEEEAAGRDDHRQQQGSDDASAVTYAI